MRAAKVLLTVIFSLTVLCGCAEKPAEQVTRPSENSVVIGTFGTLEPVTSVSSETLPEISVDSITTQAPEETERSYKTESETEKTESEPSEALESVDIAPASGTMKASSSVNVREAPDPDSKRLGHLDKDEKVEITGLCANGWVRIVFKDDIGYVNGGYLKSIEVSTAAASTTAVTTAATKPATTTAPIETTVPTTVATTETTVTTTEAATETTTEKEETEDVSEPDFPEAIISHNNYNALNYGVQKAVWLAYLDVDDMLKNATEQQFRSRISSEYDSIVSLGCNTVYVHVRSFGDAYYYSSVYPFTAAYSDTLGVRPPYDPLKIMIDEAHARGLSFHAWINPMRTTSKDRFAEMDGSYALKQWYDSDRTNGTFLVYDRSTEYWWLSPAYPAVRALICSGVSEIVSNYDVDGIHIDDYFYPTTSSSFDRAAFEASGESDRASWRRDVVSELVREIYSTVKACNSTVLFGVSPQGNIENNRESLYADVEKWCGTAGYLDYVVPQIYYGFNDKLSFDTAAEQWMSLRTVSSVRLVIGIAAYKVGVNKEWSGGSILSAETDYAKNLGADGVAYYRSGSLFGNASSSERIMQQELPELVRSIKDF